MQHLRLCNALWRSLFQEGGAPFGMGRLGSVLICGSVPLSHEVSTGSGSDRVKLPSNLDCSGRLDPVATAPGTDLITKLGHNRRDAVGRKLATESTAVVASKFARSNFGVKYLATVETALTYLTH